MYKYMQSCTYTSIKYLKLWIIKLIKKALIFTVTNQHYVVSCEVLDYATYIRGCKDGGMNIGGILLYNLLLILLELVVQ